MDRAELIHSGIHSGFAVHPPIMDELAAKHGVEASRLEHVVHPDGRFEIWLVHPEVEIPGLFDDVAREMKAEAAANPITPLRWIWSFVKMLAGRGYGTTRWVGPNELHMILTFVPGKEKPWHLSVLPVRYGRLFDWERTALKQAFFMSNPVEEKSFDGRIHIFW